MNQYDVIIIGGGPAGTALASYLALANIKVVVFEKEQHPREHVGEALVPACNRVFEEIGIYQQIKNAGFQLKYGAHWTSERSRAEYSHNWRDLEEEHIKVAFGGTHLERVSRASYHVERAVFDEMMWKHAEKVGAGCFQNAEVFHTEIGTDGVSVKVRFKEGKEESFSSKIIIDASGRRTFIGNKNNWKLKDPHFNQCAIHTWFEGIERTEEEEENTFIHFLPLKNAWIWQIPVNEKITSVGLVAQKESFQEWKNNKDLFFWDMIKSRPKLYDKLSKGERVKDLKIEADYSYGMQKIIADRCILIGDAARFVDPIFSSGVSIALNSARFASQSIITALANNSFLERDFKEYEAIITRGNKVWYRFINLYYRLSLMFSYFLAKEKFRPALLRLLQGDVYDDEADELINSIEDFIRGVESNPKHPAYDYLGGLSAKELFPAN